MVRIDVATIFRLLIAHSSTLLFILLVVYYSVVKRIQESVTKCHEYVCARSESICVFTRRLCSFCVLVSRYDVFLRLYQDGEYVACDDEIWRAGVDLESLKNMMRSVHA